MKGGRPGCSVVASGSGIRRSQHVSTAIKSLAPLVRARPVEEAIRKAGGIVGRHSTSVMLRALPGSSARGKARWEGPRAGNVTACLRRARGRPRRGCMARSEESAPTAGAPLGNHGDHRVRGCADSDAQCGETRHVRYARHPTQRDTTLRAAALDSLRSRSRPRLSISRAEYPSSPSASSSCAAPAEATISWRASSAEAPNRRQAGDRGQCRRGQHARLRVGRARGS